MSIFVYGNAARELEVLPAQTKKRLAEKEEYEARRRRAVRIARKRRAVAKQRLKIAVLTAISAVLFTGMIVMALNGTVQNNKLMGQISSLEAEYAELQAQNNFKEYDIKKSVDLNTVIKEATDGLGMVRASADQIVTYKAKEAEYIQLVAERSK